MPQKYVFKVLISGQGGVGKTTMLQRAVSGKFVQDTNMTIGVEFHLLNQSFTQAGSNDPIDVTLQLWDFGGQERFRFMLNSYVAGAKGALLLYDLTRLRTLDNLGEWVDIVRQHEKDLPILFVGTKLDRVDDITVSDDYAKDFLSDLNLYDLIKTSSKDGDNIKMVFRSISKRILNNNQIEVVDD